MGVKFVARGLMLLAANLVAHPVFALDVAAADPSVATSAAVSAAAGAGAERRAVRTPKHATFENINPSTETRQHADWVVDSGDNAGSPFVIVDKIGSSVYVFDAQGRLRGAASALLGLAQGDDSAPGIGTRALSTLRSDERTTPAGRFVATLELSLHGEEILWVDYDAGIALHRVSVAVPAERRLQRLLSPKTQDRRITYGCINVPVKFFDSVVRPAFHGTAGIVYVLPETRSARELFGSYVVEQPGAVR